MLSIRTSIDVKPTDANMDSDEANAAQFQFVNSTIDTPCVQQDVATRTLIRKQAMRKVSAARKQSGCYGRHNLRQFPVFIDDPFVPQPTAQIESVPDDTIPKDDVVAKREDSPPFTDKQVVPIYTHEKIRSPEVPAPWEIDPASRIPPRPSLSAYELMTMEYGFKILDLSNLTTFHVNRATRISLSADPSQVINLLQYNQWSFFSYVQSSYEHSPCVRYAADCVVARVRQILSPRQGWDSVVISHYVKALNALQKALANPEQRFDAEVLYATEILALYELLAPSEPTNWIRHSAGAARLIQLRGPERFTTEFEKSLFMAHVGAIVTECMMNNERCFLEDEAWRDVFESVIIEDSVFSDRSEMVISLLIQKSKVGGLCHDVTSAICSDTPPDRCVIDRLTARSRQLRDNLIKWRGDHNFLLGPISELYRGNVEDDKRCKVIGVYLACIMIANRFLAAVTLTERLVLEDETQSLVSQVFLLQERVTEVRPEAALFLVQTVAIAEATLATAQMWRDGADVDANVKGFAEQHLVIERWKFERYCELVGRKCA